MDTNLTPLQQKINDLVNSIYENQYFVELFERTLGSENTIDQFHLRPNAISILNDFWFNLPDAPHIRTPVFFQLCDVLEDEDNYEQCSCGEDGGTSCGSINCRLLAQDDDPAF